MSKNDLSRNGFALIEVLIAVAVMGIVMATMGTLFGLMSRNEAANRFNYNANAATEEIRYALGDVDSCTETFKGMTNPAAYVAGAKPFDAYKIIQMLKVKTPPTPVTIYKAMDPAPFSPDRPFKIATMQMTNYVADGPASGQMQLQMAFIPVTTISGAQSVPRSINFEFNKTVAGTWTCAALAKMSDGIWQKMSPSINDIFYTGGQIGMSRKRVLTAADLTPLPPAAREMSTLTIMGDDTKATGDQQVSIRFDGRMVAGNGTLPEILNPPILLPGDPPVIPLGLLKNLHGVIDIVLPPAGASGYGPLGFVQWGPGGKDVMASAISGNVAQLGTVTASPFQLYTNNSPRMTIAIDGTTSFTRSMSVTGNIAASGMVTGTNIISSDRRLKKNITPLEESLEKLLQLNGVTFEWKDPNRFPARNVGLIAQDVEKVFPELVVNVGPNGMKGVAYQGLIAPLIEAVKSLHAKFTSVDERTTELERQLKLTQDALTETRAELQRIRAEGSAARK